MKKRFTAILLAALLLFSGCSERGADIIINADGYEGIILATEKSVAEAVSIPPVTLSPAESTGEEETQETEPTDDTDTTSDSSPSETAAAPNPVITTPAASATTTTTAATTTATTEAATTTAETTVTTTTAATTPAPVQQPTGTNSYQAMNYSEVRGVWISYIELSSILTGKSESQFTSSLRQMYTNCVNMGINTVYVHVRSHGDAYYPSKYYPWSKYVTGTIGKASSFDPLEIMVREAHAQGLSFQAWINPYRIGSSSDISSVSSSYSTGNWYNTSNGDRVVAVSGYYYLNPAYDEAIDLIAAGAREITANYNVDGVQIDDYFYPTTDASFDSKAFAASGYSSLSSFRLNNCDKTVKALYNAVKAGNSTALFGVAPQGNVQNNYTYMYADVKKWCSSSGYIDYIAPQIYFGFNNAYQPYETVLSQWQEMVRGTGIRLIPGLAVYKIGSEDAYGGSTGKYEWTTDTSIIKRQIESAKAKTSYGGVILYSYNNVFDASAAVKAEMDAVKGIFV